MALTTAVELHPLIPIEQEAASFAAVRADFRIKVAHAPTLSLMMTSLLLACGNRCTVPPDHVTRNSTR